MKTTYERKVYDASKMRSYTTQHEVDWLEHLRDRPEILRKQIHLILSDARRYDPTVDVPSLKRECIRLWAAL